MDNSTHRISVVCPTYNSAEFLKTTLESVLAQTHLPGEVVFSDDGSTDDTVTILESFRQEFEGRGVDFVVLNNPHRGPGATRNQGVFCASGEWIAFLDSDDRWEPGKIAAVEQAIMDHPDANLFQHWESYERLDGRTSQMRHAEFYNPEESLPSQLYRSCIFSTSALVCRKSLIIKFGGFDESLPVNQDYELWLRMSPEIKLVVIREELGSYVERGGSITAKPYYRKYPHLMTTIIRHREKGGWKLFAYRALRLTLTRQWWIMIQKMWSGSQGH